MKNFEKRMHRYAISIAISAIVWMMVTLWVVKISFLEFLFIEIGIAIFGNITTFIKLKLGLFSELLETEKTQTDDRLQ